MPTNWTAKPQYLVGISERMRHEQGGLIARKYVTD